MFLLPAGERSVAGDFPGVRGAFGAPGTRSNLAQVFPHQFGRLSCSSFGIGAVAFQCSFTLRHPLSLVNLWGRVGFQGAGVSPVKASLMRDLPGYGVKCRVIVHDKQKPRLRALAKPAARRCSMAAGDMVFLTPAARRPKPAKISLISWRSKELPFFVPFDFV